MAARSSAAARPSKGHELVITRIFNAPPALVFEAWTSEEHAMRWWGPRDFTATYVRMDVRPGGAWRACIRSPEGKDHWMSGTYREIAAPERLVFTFAWDEDGEPGPETLVTISFVEKDGRTELTFRQAYFETVENRDGHRGGWTEALDRLEAYLATAGAR